MDNQKTDESEVLGKNSKRYYWLRLKNTFFTQPEIKKLRRIPGGDTYTIIYLKMMLHSLENGGMFIYQGIEPSFEKEVALILDEEEDAVQVTIEYLRSRHLIEEGHGEYGTDFLLTEVPELIDSETVAAQRKRIRIEKEREKIGLDQKKIETGNFCNKKFPKVPQSSPELSKSSPQLSKSSQKFPFSYKEIRDRDRDIDNTIDSDSDSLTNTNTNTYKINNLSKEYVNTNETESETETKRNNISSEVLEEYESSIIKQLNDEQYEAYRKLLNMTLQNKLPTTKGNLLKQFEKMIDWNWKTPKTNEPIRNIVGYVVTAFHLNDTERKLCMEAFEKSGYDPLDAYGFIGKK